MATPCRLCYPEVGVDPVDASAIHWADMLTFTGWLIVIVAIVAVWLGPACLAAGHAIIYKRDPRSAIIWVFVSFTLPIIGPCLYWGLGINRIKRRAARHLGRRTKPFDLPHLGDVRGSGRTHQEAVGHLVSLRTVADRVTRLPMLPGNTILPLHNGERAYPRMLDAIAEAERSVTLASYIFDWDDVGHEFADALGKAARRGASAARVRRQSLPAKSGAEFAKVI